MLRALCDLCQLVHKRPLSPDVFDIGMKSAHYAFPYGALSSITNRVTGVVLSGGMIYASEQSVYDVYYSIVDSFWLVKMCKENRLQIAKYHNLHCFPRDNVRNLNCFVPTRSNSRYRLPITTGIFNTGVAGMGLCALQGGDVGALVDALKTYSVIAFPAKFCVSFSLIYHYMGGLRHMWWDSAKHGNQVDPQSPLEKDKVESQSKILFGTSGVAALAVALM